jgi:ABC-type transport system substrate-binding protein
MKGRRILAGFVMISMLLTGLAVMAVPAKAAASAAGDEKTLFVAMQQDLPDFNYWNLASNSVWKANVIAWGFEGLSGIDIDMSYYPLLAESWTYYSGNFTFLIKVRQGVTFHDGTPLTADDVVFTFKMLREGTVYTSNIVNAFDIDEDGTVNLTEINAGVIKVDDYTVEMVLPRVYGQFVGVTLGIPIVPKHIWENHVGSGGLVDTRWNDPAATTGTGPYMYKEGVAGSYRVMEKYTGYWGKNFTTPSLKTIYPPNVDTLYFKIYASVDTAILALQNGAVDYISWPVTAGRVPGLQADPDVGLAYGVDNGYFYLAFNEKYNPMGNLTFRKAVSHLIDKRTIVDIYMGGFGSQGAAALPPFWGSWLNTNVETYPFDATLATSKALLTAAGFLDGNGDGWREQQDGSPMEKLIILTPPADYDPVRIRAGQAIAKNLRDCGINAEAKAIDFDTLVSRLQSMDYQMLIIGWSLASDPVGNVFDILGPKASQNTFGFWGDGADANPFYEELLGVNTRADAWTKQAAHDVIQLGKDAKGTYDRDTQISKTQAAEGILAKALPVNVLYYRTNIEAYRTTWTGWTLFFGSLWYAGANIFCLSNLQRAGAAGTTGGVSQTVNAGISMPGKLLSGETAPGYVVAIDNLGAPVTGAAVTMAVTGIDGTASVGVTPATGVTDANGVFDFNITSVHVGSSWVNATVAKGGVSSWDRSEIKVVTLKAASLYMTATPQMMVLRPGETTQVDFSVTDENAEPVQGATIMVDEAIIGYGSVDNATVTTNADGEANMNYSAPVANLELNGHLTLTLSYNVSKAGYMWKGTAAANMLIYNENLPDWRLVEITGLTNNALRAGSAAPPRTTTIHVTAMDAAGAPLVGQRLEVTYNNMSRVASPVVDNVVTGSGGVADVAVTVNNDADSYALRVTIGNASSNAASSTVTIPYVGTTPPTEEIFGGYIDYGGTPYMDYLAAELTATVHVWDQTGADADGINASLIVSGTPYGVLAWPDNDAYWTSTWDGWGINIITAADKMNTVRSGPLNSYWSNESNWADNWDPWNGPLYWGMVVDGKPNWNDDWNGSVVLPTPGITITAGTYDIWLGGKGASGWLSDKQSSWIDVATDVVVIPQGDCSFNTDTLAYEIHGQSMINGQFVVGRSMDVVSTTYTVQKWVADPMNWEIGWGSWQTHGVLTWQSPGYDYARVRAYVYDQDNNPVSGATIGVSELVTSGGSLYSVQYTVFPSRRQVIDVLAKDGASVAGVVDRVGTIELKTGSSGYADFTIAAIGREPDFAVPGSPATPDLYVRPTMSQTITLYAQSKLIILPQQAFVSIDPIKDVQQIGSLVTVKATVVNADGKPLPNMNVELVSGGVVAQPVLLTDASGVAVFSVDTSQLSGAKAAFVFVEAKARGPGYDASSAVARIAVMNTPPAVSVLSPAASSTVVGPFVNLTGSVYDMNGIQVVTLKLDTGSATTVTGTAGAKTWDVKKMFSSVAAGEHTVHVNATDMLGVSSDVAVTFTVEEPAAAAKKTDWVAWGAAIVGWVVAVLVLLMWLMRRPKAAGTGAAEPAKPEEEELPKT